jgi:hypothetical protein
MPLMSSRIPLAGEEPEGWSTLWTKAQRERDPQKLDSIIEQMNQLLTVHEKRCAAAVEKSKVLKSHC